MSAWRRAAALAVPVWAFAGAGGAWGQDRVSCESLSSWCGLSEEQAEFLRESRRATEEYADPAAALADGFRPVGADAPAMGRHWVSLSRLFDDEIDPARPEILMYASVEGRETLVGVGFGYVASPGEGATSPANPFDPHHWHIHSGRLDMESHRTDHRGDGLLGAQAEGHGTTSASGVSVLHGWVWVDNPAGVLAPNNWALPYVRLGLSRPDDATAETDHALSLASGGADFFIRRAELFAEPGERAEDDGAEALRRAETEVVKWWRTRREGPLTPPDVEWLRDVWKRFGLQGV